jgi:NNP family nitrate/nitrite transporter-like MFS transporter
VKTLMICNVALTIPARIGVGMLVDRFGPRKVFTGILLFFAIPCAASALATHYWQLVIARLLVSGIGAGFVVGIRLVGEWFDPENIGLAEGIYGGFGNFGMAAATFALPLVALLWGGENGWRFAMLVSAALCVLWAGIFYRFVRDTPPGKTFYRPRKSGALEVSSTGDLFALTLMQVPMVLCLGIMAWKLVGVGLLPTAASYIVYALLACLLGQQVRKIWIVNRSVSPLGSVGRDRIEPARRYSFAQVAILCLCYAVTFGGELAVESMLPNYLEKMFSLSVALAGVLGAGFAFASLLARPLGGYLGDRFGRRPIMILSLAGAAAGFFAIQQIGPHWPLWSVMAVVFTAGLFLMAANGANFCIAPLIQKPLTGQIAGLIGAYGSVGSVAFLTILSLSTPTVFFVTMGVTATCAFAACFLLKEPARGSAPAQTAPAEEAQEVATMPAFA